MIEFLCNAQLETVNHEMTFLFNFVGNGFGGNMGGNMGGGNMVGGNMGGGGKSFLRLDPSHLRSINFCTQQQQQQQQQQQ